MTEENPTRCPEVQSFTVACLELRASTVLPAHFPIKTQAELREAGLCHVRLVLLEDGHLTKGEV